MTNNMIFGVPRTMRKVEFPSGKDEYSGDDGFVTTDPNEATVICSDSTRDPGVHYPCIDIDVPVKLVESSTPGHHHLYINVEMTWGQYKDILNALWCAGVIEGGYLAAAIRRERTDVRLPWIKKEVQ